MRYSGKIGYFEMVETQPGLFEEKLIFKKAQGDVIRNMKRNQAPSKVNDDIIVNNSISIVADPYAREHFFAIKFPSSTNALSFIFIAFKGISVAVVSSSLLHAIRLTQASVGA